VTDVLFARTPVVFVSNGFRTVPNATGIRTRLNPRDTVDTAVRIQPETKRVVVVSGASEWDKFYETLARDQFKELEGRLEFMYLTGLPMRELLRQVATLPADSIVLVNPVYEDGDGQKFLPLDVLDRVVAASNVPTYTWLSAGMGHGVVGGRMQSIDLMMQRVAELALRVLRGENPDTIPVVEIDWTVTEFDWRQLQRWGISESRLPEGSTILYEEPDAWDVYGRYIIGGSLLLVVQSALIGALLVQRRRRVRVERSLRESEERFRLMADTAPVLVCRAGPDKLCDYFNRPWLEFRGNVDRSWEPLDGRCVAGRSGTLPPPTYRLRCASAIPYGIPSPRTRRRLPMGPGHRRSEIHP
jgi:PAS domain-containing protein